MTIGRCLCALLAAAVLCAPALPVVAQDASIAPTPAATAGDTLTLPAAAAGPSAADDNSVLFIGTATVLIRYGDMTILTDPNFLHKGGRVPLGYGLSAERLTEPAINIENLPRSTW